MTRPAPPWARLARHFTHNAALDAAGVEYLARGKRLLHGIRLGETDQDHAAAVLDLMQPPPGALVADVGCGFGELARLMRERRLDLRFLLINANPFQAVRTPRGEGFATILGDMHRMPLRAARVDGVCMVWSLCHGDLAVTLAEAARITRPGGFLFVLDFERVAGSNEASEALSRARWFPRATLQVAACAAGWSGEMITPQGTDADFRDEFAQVPELHEAIFGGLRPIVWRMTKTSAPQTDAAPAQRSTRKTPVTEREVANFETDTVVGLNARNLYIEQIVEIAA